MRRAWLIAAALAALGCQKSLEEKKQGPSYPINHPPMEGASVSGNTPRLTIQQLRGSLPVILGKDLSGNDITWLMPSGQPGLTALAGPLGEADFVNSTADNLEPSPMYLKFMDDAARDVCARALAADYGRPEASVRTLLRHVGLADTPSSNPDGFARDLRYLKLRFHGIHVDPADDTPLAPLRTLFNRALNGRTTQSAVQDGWRAVCVALMTAPEFHLY